MKSRRRRRAVLYRALGRRARGGARASANPPSRHFECDTQNPLGFGIKGAAWNWLTTVAGDTPNTVNTSVVRTRRYLTGREVEKLIEAARKHGRYGHRDATMILLAYRQGLRASELCDLQWHQVELNTSRLHVRRSKRGTPSVHPMQGDEIRALRRLQREQEASPYVFTSERGGPMSAKSFGTLFERLGRRAGMPFTIFPHMLHHAC
jgi:integrase